MSTIEDFEDAPIGATARRPGCPIAVKVTDLPTSKGNWDDGIVKMSVGTLVDYDYVLDPLPGVPTTAREALALAWELAYPVKEGQVIPEGDVFLSGSRDHFTCEKAYRDTPVGPSGANWFRTLDPLPDPEPDWLDAPAVLAWSRWDDVRREKVWSKDDGCYKSIDGEIANWSDLCYVTPLYPEG